MKDKLYAKYTVIKNDGPADANADYFVLRLDTDPMARRAARQYARDADGAGLHELATELFNRCDEYDKLNLEARDE